MQDDNNKKNSLIDTATGAGQDIAKKLLIKKIFIIISPYILGVLVAIVSLVILVAGVSKVLEYKNYLKEKAFDVLFYFSEDSREKRAEEKFYTELSNQMKIMKGKYGVTINPELIVHTMIFSSAEYLDEDLEDKDLEDLEDKDLEDDGSTNVYRKLKIEEIKDLAIAQIIKVSRVSTSYVCYNKTTIDVEVKVPIENEGNEEDNNESDEADNDVEYTTETVQEAFRENVKTYNVGSYKATTPYNEFDESTLNKTIDKNADNVEFVSEGSYFHLNTTNDAINEYKKEYPDADNIVCNESSTSSDTYSLSYEKFAHYLRVEYLVDWKRDQKYSLNNLKGLPYCKNVGESIEAIDNCIENKEDEFDNIFGVNPVQEVEYTIENILFKAKLDYDESDYDEIVNDGFSSSYNNICTGDLIPGGESQKLLEGYAPQPPDYALANLVSVMDETMTVTSVQQIREKSGGGYRNHAGIDVVPSNGVIEGVAIYAAHSGEVVSIYTSCNMWVTDGCNGAAGNTVIIKLDGASETDPPIYHHYFHLSKVDVNVGDYVTEGTKIAEMGNSGSGSGAHLHFEIRGAIYGGAIYDPYTSVLQSSECSNESYSGFAVNAEDFEDAKLQLMTNGFPEEYAKKLAIIQIQYPSYVFKPVFVGASLDTIVNEQSGNALVSGPANSTGASHPTETGWYYASNEFIKQNMDTLNYLNIENIFQFQDLSYDSTRESQYLSQVTSLVNQTFMANKNLEYAFMKSGKNNAVDPVSLVSKVIQEVGPGGSVSSNGSSFSCSHGSYNGYYNLFNIGAFGQNPAIQGLCYATQSGSYNRPWNSIEASIEGGAQFLSSDYLSQGQQTKYFQRFNLNPNATHPRSTHQYMTNVEGAKTEGQKIYNSIKQANTFDYDYKFLIPVFE